MKVDKNIPSEPGLYLVRTKRYKWWNLILEVQGEKPFLYIKLIADRSGVNPATGKSHFGGETPQYYWWGPKIEEPEITIGDDE